MLRLRKIKLQIERVKNRSLWFSTTRLNIENYRYHYALIHTALGVSSGFRPSFSPRKCRSLLSLFSWRFHWQSWSTIFYLFLFYLHLHCFLVYPTPLLAFLACPRSLVRALYKTLLLNRFKCYYKSTFIIIVNFLSVFI